MILRTYDGPTPKAFANLAQGCALRAPWHHNTP
jgi:hypothetical protein